MAISRSAGPARGEELLVGTRSLLLAFLGFTLLAVVDLLVFADRAGEDFAWSIQNEVTAAFLGAAFAAGMVLSLLSLRQKQWSRIRVPVLTVTAYTALVLVATLVHAHRLHLSDGGALARFAAWLWLGLYVAVPVAGLAVAVGQDSRRHRTRVVSRPMPAVLVVLLAAQGAILAAGGAVLFVGSLTTHHTPMPITDFWPWDLTPLSAMVIGAWLLAFAVAAALTIRQRDLGQLLVSAVTYTMFGVFELLVLLRYREQVSAADPWLWAYVVVLVAVAATGGYGWWAARRAVHDDARSSGGRPSPVREPVNG